MAEALKPTAGQSAGQMSILNEICCNPDAEEERRKPVFRHEVQPAGQSKDDSPLRRMYEWGYDSLSLFLKTNEDPGPWWNANSSTLASNWSQVGDYANAGMWSNVWRYTYGTGEYNMRPFEVRGRAWGTRDKKTGALRVNFGTAKKEGEKPLQRLTFPHTKEHEMHRRIKNPMNEGYKELSVLHGKRVLREVQYHLGQGLRFYLVDGVFGSGPPAPRTVSSPTTPPTPTSSPSLRSVSRTTWQQEIMLVKRVSQSPIDEWAWRRPGVLVYHAPAYDFEAPRIVEEFGGPRPADMSLKHNRFVALEPYSIPMKGIIGGEGSCDLLLDTTATLCARWGFYADDKGIVTLPGESVLAADGKSAALIITGTEGEADQIRQSARLYGSRHHRLADGALTRAWDVVSAPNSGSVGPMDIIEEDVNRVQKPLPTRVGLPTALSHRMYGRRHVSGFGFKKRHNYTKDAASQAYAAGQLFKAPAKDELAQHVPRPAAVPLSEVDVVVVAEGGKDAAEAIVEIIKKQRWLYAEEAPLKEAISNVLKTVRSVKIVPPAAAKPLIEKAAKDGKL
ncbi:hypothetical protein AGDE_10469 [Angomonas deanei]|nr:hypothetical protein AGDE_10469 [Angomonas deanei]|eukprot:EPY28264.1 hypothetical protein AGDE_10469 [Angomonas deanei]